MQFLYELVLLLIKAAAGFAINLLFGLPAFLSNPAALLPRVLYGHNTIRSGKGVWCVRSGSSAAAGAV